jgi:hypothetical protein
MPKRESLACAISLCSIRRRNEVASETRMLARLGRVIYWFTLLLAALVFIAPAVQLVDAWSRKSAPPPEEVDHARVQANNGQYLISLPSGARYEVSGPNTSEGDETSKALDVLRSQFTKENSSFKESWTSFWLMLAGAVGGAILLILIGRAIRYVLSNE